MPRRLFLLPCAFVVLASGCGRSGGVPVPTFAPATNAASAPLLPANRYELPTFGPAKYQVLLGQLRGTPVVVNIWASWCGPCRLEGPHLAAAARTYGDRVQFLGVDILDARDSARLFMQEFGWTYPSVWDAKGAIRDGLGFIGQPITLFYDAEGKLTSSWNGPITPDLLHERIRHILE